MSTSKNMRSIWFKSFGEPGEVLNLEEVPIPRPGPGTIRVRVHACGLNPADWALCRGLQPDNLPCGIGFDVSGVVDAFGEGVDDTHIKIGDEVFGFVDYAGCDTAGASDYAILKYWAAVPPGLNLTEAATLPMAVETACRSVDQLGVSKGQTFMVHGGGTMMGFAAVQMGILRGARVVATAGHTFANRLREMGADVTAYGEGMVERVREIAGGTPDVILDTAPASGQLPDLIAIADGEARRVLTITDPDGKKYGVRMSFEDGAVKMRYDVFAEYAQLAAEGRFKIPIAKTYSLEDWREAMAESMSWKAHGKILLLP